MNLRPYQLEAVEAVYRHLEEKDTNPCDVIPTAGGKSLVLARIASDVKVSQVPSIPYAWAARTMFCPAAPQSRSLL